MSVELKLVNFSEGDLSHDDLINHIGFASCDCPDKSQSETSSTNAVSFSLKFLI